MPERSPKSVPCLRKKTNRKTYNVMLHHEVRIRVSFHETIQEEGSTPLSDMLSLAPIAHSSANCMRAVPLMQVSNSLDLSIVPTWLFQ